MILMIAIFKLIIRILLWILLLPFIIIGFIANAVTIALRIGYKYFDDFLDKIE